MGTIINEVGSTEGGVAKVEYKDQAGNVLWYYDDAGNFVRNGNAKITGLAGTGSRVVFADSNGNLFASSKILRGYVYVESGSTTTIPLPETMPATTYTIVVTSNRGNYNGSVTTTVRDKLLNEFKIYYWAADGVGAGIEWILLY